MRLSRLLIAVLSLGVVLPGCIDQAEIKPPAASSDAALPPSPVAAPPSESTPRQPSSSSASTAGSAGSAQNAPPYKQIEIDPQSMEQLGEPSAIGGYSLRLPKGFTPFPLPPDSDSKFQRFGWQGAERPDGSAAAILVNIMTIQPGERIPPTHVVLDTVLAGFLGAMKETMPDWRQSPYERVQISGAKFFRANHSGTEAGRDVKTHGIMYATVNISGIVIILCRDFEAHYPQTFALIEASVATLQKTYDRS